MNWRPLRDPCRAYSHCVDAAASDRLVGRAAELAVAREHLQAVRHGAAASMVIEGDAGIGKTELVHHIIDEAAAFGAASLRGEAHAFQRNRPFGAIADALDLRPGSSHPRRASIGRILIGDNSNDGSPRPPSFTDARFAVTEAIIELLEAACSQGPVVLALEDLHWADESTLTAVQEVLHRLRHAPLLLVATLRPAPRRSEVDALLDDCAAVGTGLVRLTPLTPDEVDALVRRQLGAGAGGLLTSIIAKAGGNPLLLVELLRSLASEGWLKRSGDVVEATGDELPRTLRDLVLRRLCYLPARTLDILQLASVLGDAVSIRDLAVVTNRAATDVASDLAEAFRGRLLDERDDAVVFRHQLVQQAIYEDLPMPVRRALHRDAAGTLARAGADLSVVASHLLRGAEHGDSEAVRWLRQAAGQVAAGAPSVAVEFLQRALELLPPGHDDADPVSADLAAGMMCAGQVAEAAAVAAAVLDRPHHPNADVPLRLTIIDALSLQNRAPELMARAQAALDTGALRPAERALVLTQASYGQLFSGEFVAGEQTARRALEVAELAASTEMKCWSLCALSVAVKTQGRYVEALTAARRAVAQAFDPLDHDARLRHPHFFLAMALADADEFEAARDAYASAIEDSEELGSGWLLPDMLLQVAELLFLTGVWDEAAAELEAGLRLAEQHGQKITVPQSRGYLALMAVARGALPSARAAFRRLEAAVMDEEPAYGTEVVAVAASALAEAEGDQARALDILLRLWTHDADRGVRYFHRLLGPAMGRLSVALDRADIAEQVVATMEAGAAAAPEVPTVQSAALRCRGLLEHDAESLLEAVALARRGRRVLDLAGACEDAASVLLAAQQPEAAKDLLAEALAEYERVGASAWAARVASALRGLGVRPGTRGARRRAQHGWDSLTTKERAISELVAEGLTNREVARRLHISPHTVNTHLRHVFQKLSVATRAELAAMVARSMQITHSSDVSTGISSTS
jgi:DNA-binding CsgD family transcriptional regulator